MFNEQIKEALKNLLMNKYAGLKAAPIVPGMAESSMMLDKVRRDLADGRPAEAPTVPVPETPVATPPAMPPTAVKPAMPASMPPPAQSAPQIASPAAQIPAPAPEQPQSGQYGDAARQQLYADLAAKRKDNGAWAAAGSLGDMAMRMGGNTPVGTQQNILAQGNVEDKTAREDFEAGRKGTREEMADYLKQKMDTQNFNQKERELGLRHDEIKAGREATRANKEITLGMRDDQLREKRITGFRNDFQGSKIYPQWQTMNMLKSQAEASVKNPSPYNDLQLIYATVKALDPNSVVREGEIKLFQGTANLKNQLGGAMKLAFSGQPLTNEQKQNILTLINQLESQNRAALMQHAKPTIDQATRLNIPLNEIDSTFGASPNAPQAPAQGGSGMSPDQRRARIAQLRAQQGS